jgi:sugar phosphate permease
MKSKENDVVESIVIPSSASFDLDDNYNLYKKAVAQRDIIAVTASESKHVLRKIDKRIIPILFIIYLLQYLDKNGINYASVYGLQKGTRLQGQDYSWLGSIFYFGYLLGQPPSGYLLQRLRVGKVLGIVTIRTYILTWKNACG